MELKRHARYQLEQSRGMCERLISVLEGQRDWLYQAHGKANHPLWIVAHLGLADNFFIEFLRPEWCSKPEGWDELFWFGSQPLSNASRYPSTEDVLDYFRQRRAKLLQVLDEISDDQWNRPLPADSPFASFPNKGHLFIFAAFHEGMHIGQLTVAHRGLGHGPLLQPQTQQQSN